MELKDDFAHVSSRGKVVLISDNGVRKIDKLTFDCKYSLDMLRIDFDVKKVDLQRFYNSIANDSRITHWESGSFKSYRHNINVSCSNGNSYWIGCEPNWNVRNEDYKVVTFEFNPSKVGEDLNFIKFYGMIFMNALMGARVKRFDLAIDIPVRRSKCYLVKDIRMYEEFKKSSDGEFTQYLGQRNNHGRVKLYNKAVELGLETNELTRLEITCDYSKRDLMDELFPEVYVFGHFQTDLHMSGTDKVLCIACMGDMALLNELSRDKKKKIKELIASHSLTLKFDKRKYDAVISLINSYTILK